MSTAEQKIEITVDPQDGVSATTNGFAGSSCKDASRYIERVLGTSGRETLLPEFYAQGQAGEHIRQEQ